MSITMLFYSLSTILCTITMISGIGIALFRRRRHNSVSACAAAGLGIMLLASVGSQVAAFIMSRGMSPQDFANVYPVINIIVSILKTAAWVLILMAVFGWRKGENVGYGDEIGDGVKVIRPGDEKNPYQSPS